jgi:hypothetical protein
LCDPKEVGHISRGVRQGVRLHRWLAMQVRMRFTRVALQTGIDYISAGVVACGLVCCLDSPVPGPADCIGGPIIACGLAMRTQVDVEE